MRNRKRFQGIPRNAGMDAEDNGKYAREIRLTISVPPESMAGLPESAGIWHESKEEVEQALAWGERKRMLIAWVRETVRRRLSENERRCIEMHFFEGLSRREAAARAGTNPSSVQRGLQRALEKLRDAAENDPDVAPMLRKR